MRYLLAETKHKRVWNSVILVLTLTVVIGVSYLGSADYLNQSTMELTEASSEYTCSNDGCTGGGCPGKNGTSDCDGCHTDDCGNDGCRGDDCDTCDCTNTFCSNHTGSKDYECGN